MSHNCLLLSLCFALLLSSSHIGGAMASVQTEIASRALNSSVALYTFDSQWQSFLGSGFFVAPGLVATNDHVVANKTAFIAKSLSSGQYLRVTGIAARDSVHDLALLWVASGSSYPSLPLAFSNTRMLGESVYVMGCPEGLEGTFTIGNLSGFKSLGGTRVIQISAPISPGSSGGPVLNERAEVIGVATSFYNVGQNLNFAVLADDLAGLIYSLRTSRSNFLMDYKGVAQYPASSVYSPGNRSSQSDNRVLLNGFAAGFSRGASNGFKLAVEPLVDGRSESAVELVQRIDPAVQFTIKKSKEHAKNGGVSEEDYFISGYHNGYLSAVNRCVGCKRRGLPLTQARAEEQKRMSAEIQGCAKRLGLSLGDAQNALKSHKLAFSVPQQKSGGAQNALKANKLTSPGPQQKSGGAQNALNDNKLTSPGQQQKFKSQELFEQASVAIQQMVEAKKANSKELERSKAQECLDLLGKAVDAARAEKHYRAAIYCSEVQANVKLAQNDIAGAVDTLETSIKTFDIPDPDVSSADGLARLDQSRALLASIYAVACNDPGKAEALYKQSLQRAREDKPVNHKRVAYWLSSYANFYKYQKNDEQSQAMLKESEVELSKDQAPANAVLPANASVPSAEFPVSLESKK
jgi:hypothetical protein